MIRLYKPPLLGGERGRKKKKRREKEEKKKKGERVGQQKRKRTGKQKEETKGVERKRREHGFIFFTVKVFTGTKIQREKREQGNKKTEKEIGEKNTDNRVVFSLIRGTTI